jgi:hypothetical protein
LDPNYLKVSLVFFDNLQIFSHHVSYLFQPLFSLDLLLFITFRNQTQSASASTNLTESDDDEGENMTTNSNVDSVTLKKQRGAGDEDTQSGFTGDDRSAKRQKAEIEIGDSDGRDGNDDSLTQRGNLDDQDEQFEAEVERVNPESKEVASEGKSLSLVV